MYYPLNFRFKLMTSSPEIDVMDVYGGTICHVRQQFFRLKEKVEVFADDSERTVLATIEADRIIDWSARYTFKSPTGQVLGAVGRRGMKSMWKAHYDVFAPGEEKPTFAIQNLNPLITMVDALVSDMGMNMLSGYLLRPSYLATRREGGTPTMRLTKQPSLFDEGSFGLKQEGPADEGEQLALMLSFLMMSLLEQARD